MLARLFWEYSLVLARFCFLGGIFCSITRLYSGIFSSLSYAIFILFFLGGGIIASLPFVWEYSLVFARHCLGVLSGLCQALSENILKS